MELNGALRPSSNPNPNTSIQNPEKKKDRKRKPKKNNRPPITEMETLTLTPKTTIQNLPPDTILNIFSRLPIHSIFQSRQVSPSWRSLINGRDFRIMHHTHFSQRPNHPTSLIMSSGTYHTSKHQDLHYLHDLDTRKKEVIKGSDLPFASLLSGISIVGSCNGFVCFSEILDMMEESPSPVLIIANPVNGDWIKLPDLPNSPLKPDFVFFGFGYNSKKNEYKVVRLEDRKIDGKIEGKLTAHVMTLGRENLWRCIEATTRHDIPWDNFFAVHVNGVLHWSIYCHSPGVVGIKTFNLEDETFGDVIPVPHSVKGEYCLDLSFGVLEGHLMIVDHSPKTSQPVWLMKNKTWVIEFIIPMPPAHPDYGISDYDKLRPLCMLKNGNVLIQSDAALFSFEPKTRRHTFLRVAGLPHCFRAFPHVGIRLPHCFRAFPHVGTLARLEDVDMQG